MNKLPSDLFDFNEDIAEELGIDPDFDTSAHVLVVTGGNASGKSFLRRLLRTKLKIQKIEAIDLSQEGRSSGGFVSCMVYGDESRSSTGSLSAHTFIAGMNTSRNRKNKHVIIWDEPEIGMGEELQLGTVQWLFDELKKWPSELQGVVLLTHSRYFVQAAFKHQGSKWYNLEGHKTPESWLNRKIEPVRPDVLCDASHVKFRKLVKLMGSL